MSNGDKTEKDVRRRSEKRLTDEAEAVHSMTSQDDQRVVEERERARDAISRARPRDDNSAPDPDTREGVKMPSDRRG